jgi:hypothetical protein
MRVAHHLRDFLEPLASAFEVEVHRHRQRERAAQPVREVIQPAQRVRHRVRQPDHAVVERRARYRRGERHRPARLDVLAAVGDRARQIARNQPYRFERQHVRERVRLQVYNRLDGVCKRVQPRLRGGGRGQVARHLGVDNRQVGREVATQHGHFLAFARVGEHRDEGDLAARACGGGDSDQRLARRGDGVCALVVAHAPAVRADGVDELRAVHHAAPADGNHHIDRLRVGNRRLDALNRGVRHDARVEAVAHALRLQLRLHRLRQTRPVDACVRDNQRACPTVQTALEA